MYVANEASEHAVRVAVRALPLPWGVTAVRTTTVSDVATTRLGYTAAVHMFGPYAEDRCADYAMALAAELGVTVLTGAQIEDQLLGRC